MINWKKFQDMALQNQILADPMKLIKDNFVDNILSMGDVVMKIIDPKAAKNMLQGNVILRNIISMIKAIYQSDIEKILIYLKDLRIIFGI